MDDYQLDLWHERIGGRLLFGRRPASHLRGSRRDQELPKRSAHRNASGGRYNGSVTFYRGIRSAAGSRRAKWRTRRLASRIEAADGSNDVSTIRPGSHQLRVQAVQEMVNRATTQRLKVDGVYGESTIAGVAFLQRRVGLPVDGIADPLTLILGQARISSQKDAQQALRHFLLRIPSRLGSRQHLLIRAPQHQYIPRVLEESGLSGYEPETLAIWLAALDVHATEPAFDVGANSGLFSLLAAAHGDRPVVAFEPTPDLAGTVRRVADENNLKIKAEQIALGDRNGVAALHLSQVSDASNSLAVGFRPSTKSLTVQVRTLDSYCRENALFPRILKIDTETTEADVLQGALDVIREHRPWILCELLPGHRENDVPRTLLGLGYRYIHISPDFSRTEHDSPFGDERDRNWLLAPESPPDAFWKAVRGWHSSLTACTPVEVNSP